MTVQTEIIYCEDCCHWQMNGGLGTTREAKDDMYLTGNCHIHGDETLSIDFCSYGKRDKNKGEYI